MSAAAKAIELRFLVGLSEIIPSEKNPERYVKALQTFKQHWSKLRIS